jgi:hypothetical protein
MLRKFLLLVSFLAVASANLLAQPSVKDIIPAGTLLNCTLDEPNFSSKTAMVGDPVLCHLGPLGSFGHSVFPRGAMLGGHLQDYKDPGHFVGKGFITIEFDRMILPGAQTLPLAAKVISAPHYKVDPKGDIRGRGHPTRDAVEWAIPVLWPIKLLTLPARGPYPALKGETRLALRLMEDVEVPFATSTSARSSIPMPPWAVPSSYQQSSYSVFRPALATEPEPPQPTPAVYRAQPQVVQPLPPQPNGDQPLTIVALKDGGAYLARQYWVEGGQMHCVSGTGDERLVPLERIDLAQTLRVNQERHIDFVLQSRDPTEQ